MKFDRPIAIAVTLFVILLLVFFFVMPEYKTFIGLQTQLGEKRAEYQAEFDYYAAISQMYFKLQGRSDDVKKIDDALPTNPDIGGVVYNLQQAATGSGMMVKDLFLSKSSSNNAGSTGIGADNNVKDMVFSIDLLGDYSSLEKFIVSLEKSSRIFEVTSITFGSASEASSGSSSTQSQFQIQQIYSFNLQIKTHSY